MIKFKEYLLEVSDGLDFKDLIKIAFQYYDQDLDLVNLSRPVEKKDIDAFPKINRLEIFGRSVQKKSEFDRIISIYSKNIDKVSLSIVKSRRMISLYITIKRRDSDEMHDFITTVIPRYIDDELHKIFLNTDRIYRKTMIPLFPNDIELIEKPSEEIQIITLAHNPHLANRIKLSSRVKKLASTFDLAKDIGILDD